MLLHKNKTFVGHDHEIERIGAEENALREPITLMVLDFLVTKDLGIECLPNNIFKKECKCDRLNNQTLFCCCYVLFCCLILLLHKFEGGVHVCCNVVYVGLA